MKHIERALVFASVFAFSLSPTVALAGDPPAPTVSDEAAGREHFQRGVEHTHDGDYRAALIEFRRAYSLAPNYRVLFNIGQVSYELQDYAQSLDAFERYLAEGGDEIPADRRAHVEREVKRLMTRVASVTVKVNVPDASILVDDVVVATSPLDRPLRVGAGRHKFSASAPDRIPVQRVIDLGGGEVKTITFELRLPTGAASSNEAAGPIVESPPPPPPSRSRGALWLGLGTTGALAIGTAVVGIVTLSKQGSYEDEVGRFVSSPTGNRAQIESSRDSVRTTALVFDVLAGATLIAGVTTLIIGLTSGAQASPKAATAWTRGAF